MNYNFSANVRIPIYYHYLQSHYYFINTYKKAIFYDSSQEFRDLSNKET